MISLGIFESKEGRSYDCQFLPEEKMAQAVGPLPARVGPRGVAFEVQAESEEEARQKILSAIESGTLK